MTDRTIVVLNGPNLNLLGEREPEIYGPATLDDVRSLCAQVAERAGYQLDFRQTNHEGVFIDAIQQVRRTARGMVVNAAGWTHTSVAIRDALAAVSGPVVEVHLSDITTREEFRRHSFVSDVADEVIVGRGPRGYVDAIDFIVAADSV